MIKILVDLDNKKVITEGGDNILSREKFDRFKAVLRALASLFGIKDIFETEFTSISKPMTFNLKAYKGNPSKKEVMPDAVFDFEFQTMTKDGALELVCRKEDISLFFSNVYKNMNIVKDIQEINMLLTGEAVEFSKSQIVEFLPKVLAPFEYFKMQKTI